MTQKPSTTAKRNRSKKAAADNGGINKALAYDPKSSKHDRILALLSQDGGATLTDLMDATGWQQHSLRGFLSGTVKKKLGLELTSTKDGAEDRRYHVLLKAAN